MLVRTYLGGMYMCIFGTDIRDPVISSSNFDIVGPKSVYSRKC